ncbi:DUF2267 domain-containing protein [Streptomyces coelicoflavus]|uniref:DUF2267 domain-containing protein n=1 Tax=Streptomyces coelicoflavus TaxID=285562 RepID=UPI0036A82B75
MDHDTFIGQVQARAGLDSRDAAEAATRATLETVAERIPASLSDDLAAQLPQGIGEHLRRVATTTPDHPETGGRPKFREFLDRVSQRARKSSARPRREG